MRAALISYRAIEIEKCIYSLYLLSHGIQFCVACGPPPLQRWRSSRKLLIPWIPISQLHCYQGWCTYVAPTLLWGLGHCFCCLFYCSLLGHRTFGRRPYERYDIFSPFSAQRFAQLLTFSPNYITGSLLESETNPALDCTKLSCIPKGMIQRKRSARQACRKVCLIKIIQFLNYWWESTLKKSLVQIRTFYWYELLLQII